jgi:CubicO group peptidase (beta-lactamase class C family)
MASTQPPTDSFTTIRNLIRERLVEQALPSLAVAVARDGEILWEEGFGWVDRENRVTANEHTMYSLASISKPITTTGLMLLKEQGKLELDRPINEYLGEAKLNGHTGDANGATVRRVANHTSGLPLHYHFFPGDEPYRRPAMDETIRRYGNLVTPPGEKYQYCNLGYGILDYVISRLSRKSYPDFMREELFLPLGMTRASVDIGPGLEAYAAARYGRDGLRLPFYDFDHPGGSAVFCSAHDLVRFGMFHLKAHLPDQKAILTDATIDEMQVATTGGTVPESIGSYGVGWGINADRFGYRTVNHDGNMMGVTTRLMLVPSEKLAVVALANARCDLPHVVAEEILSLLLPSYGERRAAKLAEDKAKQAQSETAQPGFQPPPELIGAWSGAVHTYQAEIPLILEFKDSGDVHAKLGDQLKTLLNDAAWIDGELTGVMMGDIGTEDANRQPYHLHAALRLRGDRLNGAIVALSPSNVQFGNALGHWAELTRSG